MISEQLKNIPLGLPFCPQLTPQTCFKWRLGASQKRGGKCVKHTFLPSALCLGIAGWPGSSSSSMKIAFDQFATTCIKHCKLVTLQLHLFDMSLFRMTSYRNQDLQYL